MNARQGRCGMPHCQWCGAQKLLIDVARPSGYLLLPGKPVPPTACFLCPHCDEAGKGAGPLASIVRTVAARDVVRRTKESEL